MTERNLNPNPKLNALIDNIEKVIVGKRNAIELIVAAMLAGGHILIEDVPGVGKTQLVSALANSCKGVFGRLQMTPDIMPTDITGFTMINTLTHESEFRKGAAFCNFLLADEINRSSPKSQSALLEIMEEQQVSMDGTTYPLPRPFMVLATQNPVETYGTYHLPEAQMDRFLMRIAMGYPSPREEMDILARYVHDNPREHLAAVVSDQDILALQTQARNIFVSEKVMEYMVALVNRTRNHPSLELGVSPRGTLALMRAAQGSALLQGRNYCLPDDVQRVAIPVLAHRLALKPEAKYKELTCERIMAAILKEVRIPVMGEVK